MTSSANALRFCAPLAALLLFTTPAGAHIGSPDIYLDGKAGPYQMFVTVRTPLVIPGVAELEVRSATEGITRIRAVPLPMSGPGAKFAPVADQLTVSSSDKQLFSGSLWMMAPGSWQVRISVEGARGPGILSVPVPAAAVATKRMQFGLGAVLLVLGLFLVAGVVAMAGASVREARLDPGVAPSPQRVRAGRIAMGVAALLLVAALWGGNHWWNSEALSYGEEVYKPLKMTASLSPDQTLSLRLSDPGWLSEPGWHSLFTRSVDDFIPDHNHLMHLYVIRQPGLDVVYHLHPEPVSPGIFQMKLPSMPAGAYGLYADVVHANGFPETLVSTIQLGQPVIGRPLGIDEASGSGLAWQSSPENTSTFVLPDRYRMTWVQKPGELRARQPVHLHIRLDKPDGTPPGDMALYMGMPGHAAIVKTDGSVFAHIHPAGSVSMAALMLAEEQNAPAASKGSVPEMEGMHMPEMDKNGEGSSMALPNEVTFPYGFPKPGRYRILVQMKHGTTVETGIFDVAVA